MIPALLFAMAFGVIGGVIECYTNITAPSFYGMYGFSAGIIFTAMFIHFS